MLLLMLKRMFLVSLLMLTALICLPRPVDIIFDVCQSVLWCDRVKCQQQDNGIAKIRI